MAPAAAQSVVAGRTSTTSACEVGFARTIQPRVDPGAARCALLMVPPLTSNAVSRSVVPLVATSSLNSSPNVKGTVPSCVAGSPANCAVSGGAASFAAIVTVAVPISAPLCDALIVIASAASAASSVTAASVAVVENLGYVLYACSMSVAGRPV